MQKYDLYGDCPSIKQYGKHQFTKGVCRHCGFTETQPGIIADETYWMSLARSEADKRISDAQLDTVQPKTWREPTLSRMGNASSTDTIPRPNKPVPAEHYLPNVEGESCPSMILSNKHQWKRMLENNQYVYRCRWCDAPKFQQRKYLTAQGLLEEHLTRPKPRREQPRRRRGITDRERFEEVMAMVYDR
jgi:hypothetical protein